MDQCYHSSKLLILYITSFIQSPRQHTNEPPTVTPASPNLIKFDKSFELEDFDPLNENAKTIPPLMPRPSPRNVHDLASSMTSSYSPVYPNTYHGAMAAAPPQALPRRKEIDAESELLQQYGLLSLLDSSSSSSKMQNHTTNGNATRTNRNNWMEFD